ncbi:MAG: phage virion morphogenesis protein [Proteobacteria bacterium]|mgnify:CR=1 FL=1|jgi:hypothetical protein|nr:phage virion morphogenesis protein [Pseudomonadota bacterium]
MLIIDVDDQAFRDYLARLQGRLDDLTPAMQSIGQEMEGRIKGRFETETDPLGVPWTPWAPSTAASYPDDGYHRILDRYGDMLGDVNWQADTPSSGPLRPPPSVLSCK